MDRGEKNRSEVADGTILPVDGFGIIEVGLDQPGTTIKPAKIVTVAYVPRLSRNLLSTLKAVEQWSTQLVPGEESLVFNFSPRKELFSVTGARQTPTQGAALTLAAKTAKAMIIEMTGQ